MLNNSPTGYIRRENLLHPHNKIFTYMVTSTESGRKRGKGHV
jgi:hypothetical protein